MVHTAQRGVSVPGEAEGAAAVGRFVEAERRRAGRVGCRAAGDGADTADAASRADIDCVGVGRIDDDRTDRPALGGGRAARQQRPVVAAVGRLVDADARLAAR